MSLSPNQSNDTSSLLWQFLKERHPESDLNQVIDPTSFSDRSGNLRNIKRSRLSLSQFSMQVDGQLSAVGSHFTSLSGRFTAGVNDIYELHEASTEIVEERIESYNGRGSNPGSRNGFILWHAANSYSPQDIARFIASFLQIRARAEQEAYDAALADDKSVEEANVLACAAGQSAIAVEFPDLPATFNLFLVRLAPGGRHWLKTTHLWAMLEELGYDAWQPFLGALTNIGAEIGVLSTYNYTSLSDNQLKIEYQKPDAVFYIDFNFNMAKLDDNGNPTGGSDYETYRPIWDEVDNDIIDRVRTHNNSGLSSPMAIYRKARPKMEIWIGTHGPYNTINGRNANDKACGSGATKLNGGVTGINGTVAFVSAIKKRLCAKFYANPGSFIGSVPTEEAVYPRNNTLVIVKFDRAFTLDDFK